MSGIKQRRTIANYLEVGGQTPSYALLGVGAKTLDETPAAQTSSVKYICDKSASKRIIGYDWTTAFDIDQIRDEAAIEFICAIGEQQKIGSEAETDYVVVDLDKPVADKENTFAARKFRVAIEVASFVNTDGQMSCTGNLQGQGDPVLGEFNTSTKAFTAAV